MNAVDVLKYGQQTLLRALDSFPAAAWETPGACGVWSVKDIISHLASYELVLVELLAGFTGGDGPTPYLTAYIETHDQFNDEQVNMRKDLGMEEVLAELNQAHDRVMALIAQIPPETCRQVGTLRWYGAEYALDDFLVYTYYGHKREHSAQVAAFYDVLKASA